MGNENLNKCANTYEVLTGKGYAPSLPLLYRKKLVTSEKGQKYTLNISGERQTVLFNVDGYLVTQGQRCDKLVLVDECKNAGRGEWGEIFVELKGKDVAHAIEQLRTTLQNPLFKHSANKVVKARIVASSFPANKANPVMEKAKKEFAAPPFRCELRGMKNGQKDEI